MGVIKRSDVKNHLHSPLLARIHLAQPQSQPDATGFSAVESDAVNANSSLFSGDFVAEHSSSGTAVASTEQVTGYSDPQAPLASKDAEA